jgi:hypothetical protein
MFLCFCYVYEMWVVVIVAVMRCVNWRTLGIMVGLQVNHVLRDVLGLGANV